MRSWLREFREAKGLSQEEVATAVGISRAYYTNIENGKRCTPDKCNAEKKIATALNFNWTRFFEEDEDTA